MSYTELAGEDGGAVGESVSAGAVQYATACHRTNGRGPLGTLFQP